VGDAYCDKRLPLHRLVVIFIFIVSLAIQGNVMGFQFMRSRIECNRVKRFLGSFKLRHDYYTHYF